MTPPRRREEDIHGESLGNKLDDLDARVERIEVELEASKQDVIARDIRNRQEMKVTSDEVRDLRITFAPYAMLLPEMRKTLIEVCDKVTDIQSKNSAGKERNVMRLAFLAILATILAALIPYLVQGCKSYIKAVNSSVVQSSTTAGDSTIPAN
jgi:hypothetical protein